jgi:hypothetical protein
MRGPRKWDAKESDEEAAEPPRFRLCFHFPFSGGLIKPALPEGAGRIRGERNGRRNGGNESAQLSGTMQAAGAVAYPCAYAIHHTTAARTAPKACLRDLLERLPAMTTQYFKPQESLQ